MTIGFNETEAEELERLRAEDHYKKLLFSRFLQRFREQDTVLLECAALLEGSELANRARSLAGEEPRELELQPKQRKRNPLKFDITKADGQYHLYRLTYDPYLSTSLPSGCEFINKFDTWDEAFSRIGSVVKSTPLENI